MRQARSLALLFPSPADHPVPRGPRAGGGHVHGGGGGHAVPVHGRLQPRAGQAPAGRGHAGREAGHGWVCARVRGLQRWRALLLLASARSARTCVCVAPAHSRGWGMCGRCLARAPKAPRVLVLTPAPARACARLPAVVCEATYGVSRHLPREQREAHFLQRVTDTLRGGGRVLLPVVALGRAQVGGVAGRPGAGGRGLLLVPAGALRRRGQPWLLVARRATVLLLLRRSCCSCWTSTGSRTRSCRACPSTRCGPDDVAHAGSPRAVQGAVARAPCACCALSLRASASARDCAARMHTCMHAHACAQASGMMRKSLRVYETYQEMLNEDIKAVFAVGAAAARACAPLHAARSPRTRRPRSARGHAAARTRARLPARTRARPARPPARAALQPVCLPPREAPQARGAL